MMGYYRFDPQVPVLCEYRIDKEQIWVKPLEQIFSEKFIEILYNKLDFLKNVEPIPDDILCRLFFS